MFNTYYAPEKEARLAALIESTIRPALSPGQWNATQFLRQNAEISLESPLWKRFADRKFLNIPVGALMLAESLALAEKKEWRVTGKAELDTVYTSFTEKSHEALIEKHRKQAKRFDEILQGIAPLGTNRWHTPYGVGQVFVPAFRLSRGEEQAYVSWHNESYRRPGAAIAAKNWESIVLDRAGKDALEINPVFFYNPVMELDICERQRVTKFWE